MACLNGAGCPAETRVAWDAQQEAPAETSQSATETAAAQPLVRKHSRRVKVKTPAQSVADARRRLGDDLVVQGNLDPALVLAGLEPATTGAEDVLRDNQNADGTQHAGHIFNLGHGVQPDTDPGILNAVVDLVHERTRAESTSSESTSR